VELPHELRLSVSCQGCQTISPHSVIDVFQRNSHLLSAVGRKISVDPQMPIGNEQSACIHCCISPLNTTKEAYTLFVGQNGAIKITASHLIGVRYALITLAQMLRVFKIGLLPVKIEDSPSRAVRGVLIDMNPFGRVAKFVSDNDVIDVIKESFLGSSSSVRGNVLFFEDEPNPSLHPHFQRDRVVVGQIQMVNSALITLIIAKS